MPGAVGQRDSLSPVLLGFESGTVTLDEAQAYLRSVRPATTEDRTWMPSADRDRAKEALAAAWSEPSLTNAKARAEDAYRWFTDQDAHAVT